MRSRVRLHTYRVPWNALSIGRRRRALYAQLLNATEPSLLNSQVSTYTHASAAVHTQLPALMPQAEASDAELYFLPVAPWHLCGATASGVRTLQGAATAMTRVVNDVRLTSGVRMRLASRWPRSSAFNQSRLTCDAYERAVAWVFEQPSWRAAPDRHVWVFEWPHLLRAALETELAAIGRAVSASAKRAQGILIAQEDRLGDWLEIRAQRRLFQIPFWNPPFFRLGAEELQRKDLLLAESSGDGVDCHRFDHFAPVMAPTLSALPRERSRMPFTCADEGMRWARELRAAAKYAAARVRDAWVLRAPSRLAHSGSSMLRQTAELFRRARFCLVPPGDSYVTPRVFSVAAAVCIPVFTFNRSSLPFQAHVPWEKVSLSIESAQLLRYHAKCIGRHGNESAPCSRRNPLAALLAPLGEAQVRDMQASLLRARERVLYNDRSRPPSAVHTLVAELSQAFEGAGG